MVRVEEANLRNAMNFAFEEFIKSKDLDPANILDYRPKGNSDDDKRWIRDNPTTGIIFLKKHPNAKVAWVLVKFEETTNKVYGQHVTYDTNQKLSTPEQFAEYFGVDLPNKNWDADTVVYVRSGKQKQINKNANRDFDETTPNFYMYTNHLKTNLDRLIKRLYRINEIIEKNPNAIIGGQFNIPYSATDIK